MALKDIFKKKKPSVEKKEIEKPVEKPKEIKEKRATLPKRERKIIGESWRILKPPHITEKATDLVAKNQYTFKVWPEANKIEIKKTIEDLYDVNVEAVKIINIPKKKRRLGRTLGWRGGYKKAIVKIKEGQKIEVLPR